MRVSVTDRCNLRCAYCMPSGGLTRALKEDILSFEEIVRLAGIFASLGIKKIRLTGGEPLIRKNIASLVKSLTAVLGIEEVTLTTNGVLLSEYARALKESGVKRINISLDTLRQERFEKITGGGFFSKVISGIEAARDYFALVKLNMVVMRGVNADEICDFVNFSIRKGLIIRFIEFMKITPLWKEDLFYSVESVKEICRKNFSVSSLKEEGGMENSGPAEYYAVSGGKIGFIKTAKSNCRRCNRLRITSRGDLKLCLYEPENFSLRNILRSGASDVEIKDMLLDKLALKSKVNYRDWEPAKVYLSTVGG